MNQQQALNILKMGHNVYLTGAAGSGKTFLLNSYIDFLKSKKIEVGITASTGIAATHMNGRTIHSWSGLGVRDKLDRKDIQELLKKKQLVNRLRRAAVLIIDEISMFHDFHLDMVDEICRSLRGLDLPFGGLQTILCGDFFQLPPVDRSGSGARFANNSKIWRNMEIKICYLEEQFRQEDANYSKLLNEIRASVLSKESFNCLMSRLNQPVSGGIYPTKLHSLNKNVDAINDFELSLISGESVEYQMVCKGNKKLVQILRDGCLAPENLILKKGAVVMFVQNNFEQGYVNGTLGKVVGFNNGKPMVKTAKGDIIMVEPGNWIIEEKGMIKAMITQMPLRLAWAVTVHKSQGMSLDAAEIDLSRAFTPGMGYVALSRVRKLAGIKLLGINDMAFKVNQDIIELDREFKNQSRLLTEYLINLDSKAIMRRQDDFLERIKAFSDRFGFFD